LKIQNKMHW